MFSEILEEDDVIGIDVDNTIIGTDRLWYQWIDARGGSPWVIDYDARVVDKGGEVVSFDEERLPYNYGAFSTLGARVFEFFNEGALYDGVEPYDGVVEVVDGLRESGHEVVFISAVGEFGGHYNSKREFLRRYFGDDVEMIAAVGSMKYLVNVDVMIDDRLDVLAKFGAIGKRTIWRNDRTHGVGDVEFAPSLEFTDW